MRFLLFLVSGLCWSAPCTIPISACGQWIQPQPQGSRLFAYGSYPLDARNENVTRAFILIHGTGRNADDYFQTALAAAFLAGALNDTEIVAPRFPPSGGDTGNGGGARAVFRILRAGLYL